ncbi:colicin E3/pyocin S6 family cytotoxin [Actinoplanes sp. CA-015351]|uniref:colicin E3/pyocin S6 family cytotoxin n=1 Tax=Actinoplanes sp. CA-015351 TaxID=3239897 RepID=UPI003D9512A8
MIISPRGTRSRCYQRQPNALIRLPRLCSGRQNTLNSTKIAGRRRFSFCLKGRLCDTRGRAEQPTGQGCEVGDGVTYVARQRPDFLDTCVKVAWSGNARWRNEDGSRIYEYDRLHGHVEAYSKRGRHVGVLDAQTGRTIGDAVPGRRIDV